MQAHSSLNSQPAIQVRRELASSQTFDLEASFRLQIKESARLAARRGCRERMIVPVAVTRHRGHRRLLWACPGTFNYLRHTVDGYLQQANA